MDYQITYTVQTAYMTPGQNDLNVFLTKDEALEYYANEVREAPKYFGRVEEVYTDFTKGDEVNLNWLDEVGPQVLAEHYAQYKDETLLVRLEAHLNYIKKS